MADKLLKSIKFPTLPDRYVIGDSTLTEEGAAAEAKAVGEALATKADTKGTYEDLIVGGAEQLMADEYETDKEPYLFRTTGGSADVGNREYLDSIVGGTVAWNQLVSVRTSPYTKNGVTSTYDADGTVTLSGTITNTYAETYDSIAVVPNHIYIYNAVIVANPNNVSLIVKPLNMSGATGRVVKASASQTYTNYGVSGVVNGTDMTGIKFKAYFIDLTAMFNPTIADYIYSIEQATAGAGVAWFRNYFPKDYYPYHAVSLESVQATAHKTYDADVNVIGNYALDSSLTLRGVPKLVDGKLAYDGDVYLPSGEVQRRYGLRAYQSGDESLTDAITDGTNTVYKLTTPTTETAEVYEQYQRCDPSGTEEFVTTGIVPVGHETRYPHDLKKKIETAPDSPSTDGTYMMKRSGGKNTYIALPSTPSANGAYVLTVTVSGGSASYSWAAKE